MPPKKRGKTKTNEGRKRKGKEEKEIPSKKKLDSDDMEMMDEDIDSIEDDIPSTSKDNGKRKERGGPPQFVIDIIEKKSNRRESDDEPSSSRDRREIPQFVVNIIEKKAKERAADEMYSSSGVFDDEGEKKEATMRELLTLLRILSRGRYEEISEGQTAMAISNTGTDERRVAVEEEEIEPSSESEDEWEEIELADPEREHEKSKNDIEVRVSGSAAQKQKIDWRTKWLKTEVNRKVKENRGDLEKIVFLSLVAHCRYLTRCALDEQLVPSVMLTTIPPGYHSFISQGAQEAELMKLLKWFKSAFRPSHEVTLISPKEGYRFGLTARLEKLVEKKEYEDSSDASLMLFALFHSFEWTTRLVKNFSLHFPWEKEETTKKKKENGTKNLNSWVEVWSSEKKMWISIDPLSGEIMKDEQVEKRLIQPLQYVIAVDNKFGIREIAFRYASGFSTPKFRKRRKIDDFIKETLALPSFRSDGFRARAEDVQFHSRINNRSVPTTVGELKGHPLYVMEKELKKYEAIYPKETEPVSIVRKEKVFLRSSVHHLQGSINWIKFGREIKDGEEPYKTVSKRAKVTGGPTESLPLYGYWQTRQYQVPKIIEGRIPRNEFGNIYMYRPEMCPEGGVHLRYNGMVAMARSLDLQAIPAVIGWQCQGGRNVPILEGAVVLEKDVNAFKEEMKKRVKEEEAKEIKKRETRIWGNWRRLITGAMRLKNLNEKFVKKKDDHF